MIPIVKNVKFFQKTEEGGLDLSNEDFKFIAERIQFEFFEPGEFIMHQGEKGEKFYITLKGRVAILIPNKASNSENDDNSS